MRLREIVRLVEKTFAVGDIYERTRRHDVTHPRFFAYLFCRDAGYTLQQIARHFGVHHTSVLYGARRAASDLTRLSEYREPYLIVARRVSPKWTVKARG